jgi:hypothetical protein
LSRLLAARQFLRLAFVAAMFCRASCAALRGVHDMPPYAASLPPPPPRWVPRVDVDELGAAEDDAALWTADAPQSLGDTARALVRHFRDTGLDVYAAFLAFATQLITAETVGVAAVSVAAVFAFARGFEHGAPGQRRRLVANLNWALFASAVVFPLCVPSR